jgi:hypothetical protein
VICRTKHSQNKTREFTNANKQLVLSGIRNRDDGVRAS